MDRLTSAKVTAPSGISFTQVEAGIQGVSYDLSSTGKVYGKSSNDNRRIVNSTTAQFLIPTKIPLSETRTIIDIAPIGNYGYIVAGDGTVWRWYRQQALRRYMDLGSGALECCRRLRQSQRCGTMASLVWANQFSPTPWFLNSPPRPRPPSRSRARRRSPRGFRALRSECSHRSWRQGRAGPRSGRIPSRG